MFGSYHFPISNWLVKLNPVTGPRQFGEECPEPESQPSSTSSRKRKMNLHEVWNFIEDARVAKVSMDKLAVVRKRDEHGGVRAKTVPYWSTKLLSMYRKQSQLCFFNINKLCVATDASRHDSKDFLVTTFYSCGQGSEVSAHATAQYVNTSKVIHPGQFELTAESERLAARREVERLSSLKFLQAISSQIEQISGKSLQLTSFEPSDDLAMQLCPLSGGDERYFDGDCFVVQKNEGEDAIAITLTDEMLAGIPVMKVIMDQGKIGTAAAAFCRTLGLLIRFDYDKIHRLLRDIKSMSWRFQQVVLMTTYIWGINYKPFRSGAHYDEKCCAIEGFFEANTYEP